MGFLTKNFLTLSMETNVVISFVFLCLASYILAPAMIFSKKTKIFVITLFIAALFVQISYAVIKPALDNLKITEVAEEILITTMLVWLLALLIKKFLNKWVVLVIFVVNIIMCAYSILKVTDLWLMFITIVVISPLMFGCSYCITCVIAKKPLNEMFS